MSAPVAAGSVVKGKYRIDRLLGEGGMGVVVAAHHLALDRRVAIKFLLPAMLAHPAIVERFAREARAASKIESDHVARVMDVDALDDGTPFMVMEYLEGSDLSTVRDSGLGLPIGAAVAYLLEACEAIGEAHRMGIVHRDIKPANLFLARRSDGRTRVKLLDFGISKIAAGGSEPSVTKTAGVVGSCEYMSPEQLLASRDVDGRTDIWALGITLYELLTACVPFEGETMAHICSQILTVPAGPPSALRPEVPPELDGIVLRCLEKDRERRYATVAELAEALAPFARADAVGTASRTPPVASRANPFVATAQSGVTLDGPTSAAEVLGVDPSDARRASPVPPGQADVASLPGRGGIVVSSDVSPLLAPKISRRPLAIGAAVVSAVAAGGVVLALRGARPVVVSAPSSPVSGEAPVVSATAPTAEVPSRASAAPVITPATSPEPTAAVAASAAVASASATAPGIAPRAPKPSRGVGAPAPSSRPSAAPSAAPKRMMN